MASKGQENAMANQGSNQQIDTKNAFGAKRYSTNSGFAAAR